VEVQVSKLVIDTLERYLGACFRLLQLLIHAIGLDTGSLRWKKSSHPSPDWSMQRGSSTSLLRKKFQELRYESLINDGIMLGGGGVEIRWCQFVRDPKDTTVFCRSNSHVKRRDWERMQKAAEVW
jgi:hypothetical protein